MPYLYKILADELNIPCNLAFAPNHIYIKLFSERTGWYNTELANSTFPIDASGYVTFVIFYKYNPLQRLNISILLDHR